MEEGAHDLFVRGIAAAKAGDIKEARFYLEWLLRLDPPLDQKMDALFWLCEVSLDRNEQFNYLEEILANNPGDPRARRKFAILQGKIKPDEIINPDHIISAGHTESQNIDARRFTCPTCGGRMVYAPDGQSLTCEYCDLKQKVNGTNANNIDQDGTDFIVALATLKGHIKPTTMGGFTCQGCGAHYLLTPDKLTIQCPYCRSNFVIEQANKKEIQVPDALIPLQVTEDQAKAALRQWFNDQNFDQLPNVEPGHAIYFPVWSFEIGGIIQWKYTIHKRNESFIETGERSIFYRDILVPATDHLGELPSTIYDFNLVELVLYDPGFLVNSLAETYQKSVADASLDARKLTLDKEIDDLKNTILEVFENLQVNSSRMQVQSYKLILLPFWITFFTHEENRYEILINGQTGVIKSTFNPSGFTRWIKDLLGNS